MESIEQCVVCLRSEIELVAQADEVHDELHVPSAYQPIEVSANVKLHVLPCDMHSYCLSCFARAIKTGIKEEACYKIFCDKSTCKEVSLWFIERTLETEHPGLLEDYLEKCEEYETPHTARNKAISINVTEEHECSAKDENASVDEYFAGIAENERWRWQRCYRCRMVVEKTEACDHMTCNCGAEFCLICGSKWTGPERCGQGCPKNGHPQWDPQEMDPEDGGNADDDWDPDGFDDFGMDAYGYDRDGFNYLGFDRNGFNAGGCDGDGFDYAGWDREGFNRDRNSFAGLAYNTYSLVGDGDEEDDAWLEDEGGFDLWGYDGLGYDRQGVDREGWDRDGYDAVGRDEEGYDRAGRNQRGYDRHGYDEGGFDVSCYNRHHCNAEDEIQHGYHLTLDGNVRKTIREIAFTAPGVFECDHAFSCISAQDTCGICKFDCKLFKYHCESCDADLCSYCTGRHGYNPPAFRDWIRATYPFPGDETFGIAVMIEMVEEAINTSASLSCSSCQRPVKGRGICRQKLKLYRRITRSREMATRKGLSSYLAGGRLMSH
ncbi:hypothetical protein LTR95_007825 [Oleoguttula sp. CCFEE 5521]